MATAMSRERMRKTAKRPLRGWRARAAEFSPPPNNHLERIKATARFIAAFFRAIPETPRDGPHFVRETMGNVFFSSIYTTEYPETWRDIFYSGVVSSRSIWRKWSGREERHEKVHYLFAAS